jgi:membrane protein DedA with SNARE-associated domain/membrane-associated phospholipid phosphatase
MIEHYHHLLDHYLQAHPYMGILFAFLISLIESLPLIGTVIPGSVTMTLIGVFVGRSMLPAGLTLLFSALGALLGDTIGFWIGKRYNERLEKLWPFNKHPHGLIKGKAFFENHGGKSILLGRFVGPARSSVPLIAGLMQMAWIRFFVAAVPSSVLWSLAYLFPGILIGAVSLVLPARLTTIFLIVGLAIIVLLWLLFWVIQRFFTFLGFTINRWVDRLWSWLYHHHSAKFLTWITNRRNPRDHHQLTLLLLSGVSFLIFLIFLIVVTTVGPLTNFNGPVFYLLQSIRTPRFDQFFVVITLLGETVTVFAVAVLFTLVLVIKKQWRAAFTLIGILLVSACAVYLFKSLIYSPRPTGFLSVIKSSSFPSGHTALSLTVLGFMAFLIAQEIRQNWRWLPYSVGTLLVFLVCFSRLYLGAHWLEDVLASIFLGFSILLLTIVCYRRYPPTTWIDARILLIGTLILALPWTLVSIWKFKKTVYYSSPTWAIQYATFSDWWNNPTEYLPIYRLSRFGRPIQPFNIQWSERLPEIKRRLLNQGWIIIPTDHRLQSALARFVSPLPEQNLPFFPWLYQQRPPVLFLITHLPQTQTILELRLWASSVQFIDTDLPVWIGSVNYHEPKKRLLTLKKNEDISFAQTGYQKGYMVQTLLQAFSDCAWKIIRVPLYNQPEKIKTLKWNGSILIISSHVKQEKYPKIDSDAGMIYPSAPEPLPNSH